MNSNKVKGDPNFALWTLGAVAIELLLLIPTLYLLHLWIHPFPPCPSYQYHPDVCPPYPPPFPIYPLIMPSLILYFTFPVLYCVYASCKQKPKRIVSPRQIGFWTVSVAGLIIVTMLPTADLFIYATATQWVLYLGIFSVLWLGGLIVVAGIVGYFQTLVVRALVGLNEGKPHHFTYRLNADFEKVKKAVSKVAILDYWKLREIPHETECVFKSRLNLEGIRMDNFVIIAPDTTGQTLIHGMAFIEDLYEIRADQTASNRLDRIINDMVGEIGVAKGDWFIDEHLKNVAEEFVRQCTRTKFSAAKGKMRGWLQVFNRMEKHYRNALILTAITWALADVLIVLLYFYFHFDVSVAATDANVAFFGILVVEIALPALVSRAQGVD
jgi:hypothetical protein